MQNIILSDYSKKCVFKDSKWVTTTKTCSEFDTSSFKNTYFGNYCTNTFVNDYQKKCNFRDETGSCVRDSLSCNEITFSNESEATEEKCNAIVNSGGTCTLRRDKSGCRVMYDDDFEKEKEIDQGNQGGNNNNNDNSSGGKSYQIMFGLLVFLVLF